MADQWDAMQQDIAWLVAARDRFEEAPCPACGSVDREFLYEKWGMPQCRCRQCETQYASPRPTEADLIAFYRQSANYDYWAKHVFPASAQVRRERIFRPRAQKAAALAAEHGLSGGVLLEIGAAYGLFCEEVTATGAFSRVIGIEPTPELAARCRAAGIETLETPYETARLDAGIDMLVSFEVIEHLHDPGRFLRWAFGALRPGGVLMLTCPNIRGFETLALGRGAGSIDHEHINMFHPDSLELLTRRSGFAAVTIETPGRLDFDLVRTAAAASDGTAADMDQFAAALVRSTSPGIAADFTAFLQRHKLSSHMMMVAVKAVEGAAA